MWIEMLGPVRLVAEGDRREEVPERSLRLLLVSLAVAEGGPVPADELVERLWEAERPRQPAKVLRAKLSRLRAVLDRARPGARDLLRHTPAGYRLEVGVEDVDVGRFAALIDRARRQDALSERTELLRDGLELWRGEPFGDMADQLWLAPTLARLHDLRGDALETYAEAQLELGDPAEVVERLEAELPRYPTRERLVSGMMLALHALGRQAEALETFEALRERLAEDLGVDPGARVRALHAKVLRQDISLDRAAGAGAAGVAAEVTSPVPRPSAAELPAEDSPLVGRHRESEEVQRLLRSGRLVTLTGVGGVGKTRLALHVARAARLPAEAGRWLIDLTELGPARDDSEPSADRIAHLVSRVLDVPQRGPAEDLLDVLADVLAPRAGLLLMDNCEHVVGEAAMFVGELLRRAPRVRVLATSREPLAVPGEQVFALDTLGTQAEEGEGLSEAAEFFTRRARAADPSFRRDDANADAVDELCMRLDGLPLALELAAARLRGISVADLLERLDHRFALLRRPGRGVPQRQQTLRGTMAWSWSLLDDAERAVLRRLAVHPGSLRLTAAEAVCAGDPVEPGEVAEVLIRLVDRSLVITSNAPTGRRYGMLGTVAAFAAEKLEDAGERGPAALRHLDHCIEQARQADEWLRGPRQQQALARMRADRSHWGHALAEAHRIRDGRRACALLAAMFWTRWIDGGYGGLGEDLDTASALPGSQDDDRAAVVTYATCLRLPATADTAEDAVRQVLAGFADDLARARAQWFCGVSLLAIDRLQAGGHHLAEAMEILQRTGAEWDCAVAAAQRDWFLAGLWGQEPRGLPDGREPELVLKNLGEGWGLVQALAVSHRIAESRGGLARAAGIAQQALEIALDHELWAEAADWYAAGARCAVHRGDDVAARDQVRRSRSLATDVAYRHGHGVADLAEAMLARDDGDPARAGELLGRWLAEGGAEASRDPGTHLEAGHVAVDLAQVHRAEEALAALRRVSPVRPAPALAARTMVLEAAVHVLGGRPSEAVGLLDAADGMRGKDEAHRRRERLESERVRGLATSTPPARRRTGGADSGGGAPKDVPTSR